MGWKKGWTQWYACVSGNCGISGKSHVLQHVVNQTHSASRAKRATSKYYSIFIPFLSLDFFFLGDRSSVIKNIISFLGKIFEPGLSLGSFFLSPKSHESSQWLLENVILEMLLVCSGKQCRFQAVLIKGCALRRKAAYHNCSMTGVHAACPCFKAFKCFRAK